MNQKLSSLRTTDDARLASVLMSGYSHACSTTQETGTATIAAGSVHRHRLKGHHFGTGLRSSHVRRNTSIITAVAPSTRSTCVAATTTPRRRVPSTVSWTAQYRGPRLARFGLQYKCPRIPSLVTYRKPVHTVTVRPTSVAGAYCCSLSKYPRTAMGCMKGAMSPSR